MKHITTYKGAEIQIEHRDGDSFAVYVRRSNCKKRLIYIGFEVDKAFQAYSQIRIYERDRKYFYVAGEKVLMESGSHKKESRERGRPKTAKNFQSVPVMSPRLPISLAYKLKTLRGIQIDGCSLSVAKLINLLLARVADMPHEELVALINASLISLRKYEVLSGLDNHQDALKHLESEML